MLEFKFTDTLVDSAGLESGVVPISALIHNNHTIDATINTSSFFRASKLIQFTDNTTIDTGIDFLGSYDSTQFLLGPPDRNLKVTSIEESKRVIYDYVTKKPFSDYEVSIEDSSTIFLGADTFSKHILVKSVDGIITILRGEPRYSYTNVSGSTIDASADSLPGTLVHLVKNPLNSFNSYIVAKEEYKSWKARFRVCEEIIADKIVSITAGTSESNRTSVVTDEKVNILKENLIQAQEQNIVAWPGDTPSGYYKSNDIIFNKDVTCISKDLSRGLILLNNPPPKDLTITYFLEDYSWKDVNLEMNPLIDKVPGYLSLELNKDTGIVYYRKDNDAFLYDINGQSEIIPSLTSVARNIEIASFIPKFNKPRLIDVRSKGGMLKDTDDFNTDSHTSFGFMGINPTQLNVVAVHLPDTILETLIIQFSDQDDEVFDWSTKRETYINFIRTTLWKTPAEWLVDPLDDDDLLNENPIKAEVLQNVTRHLSAGILALIYDNDDNLIFISNK